MEPALIVILLMLTIGMSMIYCLKQQSLVLLSLAAAPFGMAMALIGAWEWGVLGGVLFYITLGWFRGVVEEEGRKDDTKQPAEEAQKTT